MATFFFLLILLFQPKAGVNQQSRDSGVWDTGSIWEGEQNIFIGREGGINFF